MREVTSQMPDTPSEIEDQASFTQGPWYMKDGWACRGTPLRGGGHEIDRLIASAPELYAALQEICHAYDELIEWTDQLGDLDSRIELGRSALKKAAS